MSSFYMSTEQNYNLIEARLEIDYLLDDKVKEEADKQDVISGLRKKIKSLPARYFYDQLGSQLFEQICELPEYYPTRTEASILSQYAQDIVQKTQVMEIVELGSGSSTKTRYLLDAYPTERPLYYTPVDVSGSILKTSAYELLKDYPQLKIKGKVATYNQALQQLNTYFLGKRIIIFLGSSIGNFDSEECDRLIEKINTSLNSGDYFLLGIDLQKPLDILLAAYNDAQGVTAAFNLNMLQHLNNRFQANFDLNKFKHEAIYNQTAQQIEMYLISQQAQSVTFASLDLTIEFEPQERILTEISRKFDLQQMKEYLSNYSHSINGDRTSNLKLVQTYTDPQQWFGLLLCQKT